MTAADGAFQGPSGRNVQIPAVAARSIQILEGVCSKQVSISLQELQSEVLNCLYLFMLNSSIGQLRNLGASSHCPLWRCHCRGLRRDRVMFGDTAHLAGTGAASKRCCSSASATFLLAQAKPSTALLCWGCQSSDVMCATLFSNYSASAGFTSGISAHLLGTVVVGISRRDCSNPHFSN